MSTLGKIINYLTIAAFLFLMIFRMENEDTPASESQDPKYNFTLSLEEALEYYPEADSVALDDVALYNIYNKGNYIGRVVNTSPFSDNIYGYNGTTPLTIYLNENDIITEVRICENRESRGYLNKVINSGYLDTWDGLSPKEAVKHQVDAVSGCTFTSVAIAQSLQARMEDLSKQSKRLFTWDWNLFIRQICILIVTTLALICFSNPKKTKKLRLITLLLSIGVLGLWTNSLLSLALFCNWLTNGISLALQIPIFVIAAISILLPLFTKKSFYCQYLCPFGAAQEFVGMIPVKKLTIPAKLFKIFALLRKIILLILVMLFAFGTGLDLSVYEPFPIFNYQSIGFGVAIFAAIILITSIFVKKPWCNYLCPTGTLLEIFRNLR